jgi:hypothetical protein
MYMQMCIHILFSWLPYFNEAGAKRNAYRILMGKPEGKSRWVDQDVDGWIVSTSILER